MIGFYALGPLGLAVAALSIWSLYNALRRGRVRSHGWIYREAEPKFFWFVVAGTVFVAVWFGLIGILVTAKLLGLIG